MRDKLKQLTISLVVMLIILTSIPLSAFADSGVGDKDNEGRGGGGGKSDSSFTWSTNKSGYRFTIIDNKYKPVSNVVDIVFRDPKPFMSGVSDWYKNSRAGEGIGYTIKTIENIYTTDDFKGEKYPPMPIVYTTSSNITVSQAKGYEFKQWFLADGGSINPPSTGSGGGGIRKPTQVASGTTKPSPRDWVDMGSVSTTSALMSASYRSELLSISKSKLSAIGIDDSVLKKAQSSVNRIKALVNQRILKEQSTPINQIQYEVIRQQLQYLESTCSSNAESAYIYCYVINNAYGSNWFYNPNDGSTLSYNYPIQDNMMIGINEILREIPLSGGSEDKGHAKKLLNLELSDGYLFEIAGTSENKNVVEVMAENNYSIIVEPILFFIPANVDSSGLPGASAHSNYVYGTIGNIIEFYNKYPQYGAYGGAYTTPTSSLGWRSMFLGEDWIGQGVTIKGFKELTGKESISALANRINQKHGIAMHIYVTNQTSYQVTRDFDVGILPHGAPDPTPLPVPTGDSKIYNIFKYYELKKSDGSIRREKFATYQNPPQIMIYDEDDFKLQEWFIAKSPDEGLEVYLESKAALYSRGGAGGGMVTLSKDNDEKSLHLLYTRDEKNTIQPNGDIIIEESEISKAMSSMDQPPMSWGSRNFLFEYGSMDGSHTHYCGGCATDRDGNSYCVGRTCKAIFGKPNYYYEIMNSATIDNLLEANSAGGSFKFKMVNHTMSGNANIKGGKNTLATAEYQTTIWRGLDIPTIASYKEKNTIEVNKLLKRYGKEPAGDRASNGGYLRDILIQLDVNMRDSDLLTHTVHSYDNSEIFKKVQHDADEVSPHIAAVAVRVYRGDNNKTTGNATKTNEMPTTIPFGGSTSFHSAGFMVQNSTPIQFYPYIRMTYQTTGNSNKTDVNILSQFYSELLPNDFAEAAWYQPNEEESLKLSSVQWSLHAKAVSNFGRNTALPGGALYQLSTGDTPSKVGLVTWQTVIEDPERSALAVDLPSNEYTTTKADAEHKNFVEQAKLVLESLKVVQWVNVDKSAQYAWTNNGKAIKVTEGGQSLSVLGLSGQTSSESKYYLKDDGSGDAANEGDLDVIRTTDNPDYFFKVFADTSGNVYLAKGNSVSSLKNVNGTNVGGATKILSKADKSSDVASKLSGEARELEQRTLLISNFVKSLERNQGNDKTASWASDGKWYNEAWDGIYVIRKQTILDVGFDNPKTRTAALDPKLCPPSTGQRDMFTQGFLSQFRTNEKSNAALNEPNGYIGAFKGKGIILKDMESLYVSRKIIIPNVTVQDLN